MSLTPDQIISLRAAAFLDPTAAALIAAGNSAGLQGWLNADSGVSVWRSDAPTLDLLDAIDQSGYTPNSVVSESITDLATLLRMQARATYAQTKLMVLQNFVLTRQTLDCRPVVVRKSLRDSVVAVPTGASGANTAPGGANGDTVLARCARPGSRAELAMAAPSNASDQTGSITARVMTLQGAVEQSDATQIVFKPNGDIWTVLG